MAKGSRKKRRKRKNRRYNPLANQRLMNKVKHSRAADEMVFVTNAEVKMSQVILDFAQPVLERAKTEEEFRTGIGLAALAWNASLLEESEREEMINKPITESLPNATDTALVVLEMLIARKHQSFANHKRFIIDYELSGTPPDLQLSVISSP